MDPDDAWTIFDDYVDPYDLAIQNRQLSDPGFLDLEGAPLSDSTVAKKAAAKLQKELNKLALASPMFACIARTTEPNLDQMYGAFLCHGSPQECTPVVLDAGASISVSPFKDDFIGKIKPLDSTLTGLSDAAIVEGIGWVEWYVRDYHGKVGGIKTQT